MKQTSEYVYEKLSSFDSGRITGIYPLIAEAETRYPFCVYQVDRKPSYSKVGFFEYEVQIRIISENYDELMFLVDDLNEYLKQFRELIYLGTTPQINIDKPSEFVIVSSYQMFKNT